MTSFGKENALSKILSNENFKISKKMRNKFYVKLGILILIKLKFFLKKTYYKFILFFYLVASLSSIAYVTVQYAHYPQSDAALKLVR